MARRMLGTALLLVMLTGCTSVRSVDVGGGEAQYQEFNSGVRGKVARVMLHDGQRMDLVSVRLAGDSLTWLDRSSNVIEGVPVRDVAQVSVVKAGSGALRGLLFGVVAGAAFGGMRAALEGDDPVADPLAATQQEKYRIYPPAHAVYASLATTPFGAMIGTRRIYRFEGEQIVVDR